MQIERNRTRTMFLFRLPGINLGIPDMANHGPWRASHLKTVWIGWQGESQERFLLDEAARENICK